MREGGIPPSFFVWGLRPYAPDYPNDLCSAVLISALDY